MVAYWFLMSLFVLCCFVSILAESIFISLFCLISLFVIASLLFIMLGFEFIGFLYLIVYVGAVAVLFLFMVMLFDKSEYFYYIKIRAVYKYTTLLVVFLLTCILFFFFCNVLIYDVYDNFFGLLSSKVNVFLLIDSSSSFSDYSIRYVNVYNNMELLGLLLYKYYWSALFAASLILLVGMIGVIVITQFVPINSLIYRKQDIVKQTLRRRV